MNQYDALKVGVITGTGQMRPRPPVYAVNLIN